MAENTKAPLPAGKGIVVRLDRIPKKTREKPKFKGEGTKTVCDIPFVVDDRNYLDHFDRTIFLSLNDRIRSGNGDYKSTDSYRFVEQGLAPLLAGKGADEKAEILAPYDGNNLSKLTEDLANPLLRHYVLFMKEPRTDAEGRVWQDPKELRTLEEMEWELDRRRVPVEEIRKRLGMPIPKQNAAAAQQPPTPPPTPPQEERPVPPPPEPLKLTRTFGDRAAMVKELRGMVGTYPDQAALKDDFLKLKGAPLVKDLSDDDVKHLMVLAWLEEHRMNGGIPSAHINDYLIRKHLKLHQLPEMDAITLLAASDHEATQDRQF